jgi:uncharacterized membrane protein YjdF
MSGASSGGVGASRGSVSTIYLGTQGDEWDAQKDKMAALTGAVIMAGLIRFIERRDTGPTRKVPSF